MLGHLSCRLLILVMAGGLLLQAQAVMAEQVPVRHKEGLMHGFLTLRNLEGKTLADGEMTQTTEGDRVTSHLIFRFRDGSRYDDNTIFRQDGRFRLLSDHLIQRGPSFKQPMDTSINGSTGQITVDYKDSHDKEKLIRQQLKLPPDVANGMLFTLVRMSNQMRRPPCPW
jgi:hypothetical protein